MNVIPNLVKNNALIGFENNLFLFDGAQKPFAFSSGEIQPSSQSILNFFSNLESRNCFLSKRGMRFIHLVFPSKEIVLKDKLPDIWRERIEGLFLRNYYEKKLIHISL